MFGTMFDFKEEFYSMTQYVQNAKTSLTILQLISHEPDKERQHDPVKHDDLLSSMCNNAQSGRTKASPSVTQMLL